MKASTRILLAFAFVFQMLFFQESQDQEAEQEKYLKENAQNWTKEQRLYALSSFWMYVKTTTSICTKSDTNVWIRSTSHT